MTYLDSVVNPAGEVLAITRRLSATHNLKALDLIHLASAVYLYSHFGSRLSFAGADRQLLHAAEIEGLRIIDVEKAVPL